MAVHLVLLTLVLQLDLSYWKGVLQILFSHLVIDVAKSYAGEKFNDGWVFFLDQAAHLCIILWVVRMYRPYTIDLSLIMTNEVILFVLGVLVVTAVASVIIRVLISNWADHLDESKESLKNAGMYIGMLERLFVFGFVVIGQWQAIGFLLAAKSVFRFGDLSNSEDRKLTEYVLIGTLLSFGLAILTGLAYLYLVQQLPA